MDDGPGECSVSVCDVMRTVASSSPLSLSVLRWAGGEAQMGDTGQSRDDSATGQTWVLVNTVKIKVF